MDIDISGNTINVLSITRIYTLDSDYCEGPKWHFTHPVKFGREVLDTNLIK